MTAEEMRIDSYAFSTRAGKGLPPAARTHTRARRRRCTDALAAASVVEMEVGGAEEAVQVAALTFCYRGLLA